MKTNRLAHLIASLLALVLSGCERRSHTGEQSRLEKPLAAVARELPKSKVSAPQAPFAIKGFYVGMTKIEAAKVLEERHSAILTLSQADMFYAKNQKGGMGLLLSFDASGLVFAEFSESYADVWFNARDMDQKTFAREFIKSYGVPEMEPFEVPTSSSNLRGWKYRNPNAGYEIAIYGHGRGSALGKNVSLKRIPKSQETRFD